MPPVIYDLMDLYPQANAQRPSVLYVPIRRPTAPQILPAGAAPGPTAK